MDAHLTSYSEIIELIHKWDSGIRDSKSPEILALRQFDIDTLTKAISAILLFGEVETRLGTIEILRHVVPQPVMIDLLIPALSDPRSSVRWTVCKLFERHPHIRQMTAVIKVLQEDENPSVRVAAADVLCAIGNEGAIAALGHAAEHDFGRNYENRTVSEAAREAIQTIRERTKSE